MILDQEIKQFMTAMPHTIGHDISVAKAKEFMTRYRCHHLPVLDGGNLVGIVSERDLRLANTLNSGEKTTVETLMTDEPVTVDETATLKSVVKLMLEKQVGSVVVKPQHAGSPWGIFTTTDALRVILEN